MHTHRAAPVSFKSGSKNHNNNSNRVTIQTNEENKLTLQILIHFILVLVYRRRPSHVVYLKFAKSFKIDNNIFSNNNFYSVW